MEFGTLLGQFASTQPKGYKFHPRQIETARAVFAEAMNQGIDPRFALAITWQESSFGGNGKQPIFKSTINNDKGRGHAYGFMQVLEGTAAQMGLGSEFRKMKQDYEEKGVADPATSAKLGVTYLKTLAEQNKLGTVSSAAAGYYGGPGNAKGKFTPQIRKYVDSVSRHMGRFEAPTDESVALGGQVSWSQPIKMIAGQAANFTERAKNLIAPPSQALPPSITAPMASAPIARQEVPQVAQADSALFASPIEQPIDYLAAMNIGLDTASSRALRQQEPITQLSWGGQQPDAIDVLRKELGTMYDTLQNEGSFG